jgi:hypothetical protein
VQAASGRDAYAAQLGLASGRVLLRTGNLTGNLAFHLGDYPAAQIHLSTAARLGTAAGDTRLTCWALGAQPHER